MGSVITRLRSLVLALACLQLPMVAAAADTTPPVIKHTPVTKLTRGENLIVMAHMKDESAIFGATLWYRAPNTLVYSSAEMVRKGEDLWGAQISTTTDVEYYIEAYDEFGNGPSWAGSPKEPFLVKVVDAAPAAEAKKEAEPVPEEKTTHKATEETAKVEKSSGFDGEDLSLPSGDRKFDTSAHNDDDLSEPSQPKKNNTLTIATPVPPAGPSEPVYKQWWFIGGASVIGVAAITTVVILLQPQPVERNVFGTGLRTP